MKIYIYFNIEFYSKTFFFFQECIKLPSLHSPSLSNLTDQHPEPRERYLKSHIATCVFPKHLTMEVWGKMAIVILQQNWICHQTLSTNCTKRFSAKNFPHYGKSEQKSTYPVCCANSKFEKKTNRENKKKWSIVKYKSNCRTLTI